MKITRIEAQVKIKGRYSVYVDEKFAFGISELGLINSGLKIGQELDKNQLDELKGEADTDKLLNRTLELILRRPRSRWELEDYLKRKTDDPELIAKVLYLLSEKGYVNDAAFARRWVENRRLLKNTSKRKLSLELKQKRVSDEDIKQALEEDKTDEREVLRAEIDKKRRQTRYQDDQKLIAYLARQGYRYEDIKFVLDNLNPEEI